jgi:hypothetical protein
VDEDWVRANPDFLRGLRDPAFARRRDAFDLAVAAGVTTPDLVARAMADPAALLRRRALEVAGEEGFTSLVAAGLGDDAWAVRQAAVAAGVRARSLPPERLVSILRADPAPPVRLAAARGLLALRTTDPVALDALVGALADPDENLAAEIERGLFARSDPPVVLALWRSLRGEAGRREPRPTLLARLFLAFERTAGLSTGFTPGLARADLVALVDRLEPVVRRLAGAEAPRR